MSTSSSRYLLAGLVLGLLLTLGAAAIIFARPYTYQGSVIDPPAEAADFTLIDQDGQPFSLSAQQGKVVLLFFGYTHCPDVCPATLANFQQISQELAEQAGEVIFVFVTVDPERDTPQALRVHVDHFNAPIIGLTGERADLEAVWKSYGVFVEKDESESSLEYSVSHTARTYVIDPEGNLRMTYPFGFENGKIVEDLVHLLREPIQ